MSVIPIIVHAANLGMDNKDKEENIYTKPDRRMQTSSSNRRKKKHTFQFREYNATKKRKKPNKFRIDI